MSWLVMTAAGAAASTCAGVLYELVRARRLGRAAERGDVLELEGSIVGRLRYCHPPGACSGSTADVCPG